MATTFYEMAHYFQAVAAWKNQKGGKSAANDFWETTVPLYRSIRERLGLGDSPRARIAWATTLSDEEQQLFDTLCRGFEQGAPEEFERNPTVSISTVTTVLKKLRSLAVSMGRATNERLEALIADLHNETLKSVSNGLRSTDPAANLPPTLVPKFAVLVDTMHELGVRIGS